MATQTLTQAQSAPETTLKASQNPSATLSGATSGALSMLDALTNNISTWAHEILDRYFPPEQREALLSQIKAFALANPKVSVDPPLQPSTNAETDLLLCRPSLA